MKRIVVFDANPLVLPKSGIGYYVEGLITALSDASGEDVQFVGHYFNFLGRKNPTLPMAPNIRYVESRILPGKFLSFCRKLGFQLPYELFTRTKADTVVFTNYVSQPTFFKTKKIQIVYDLGFVDCPEFVAEKNGEYLRKWVPKTLKNADLVITISSFVKNRLYSRFSIPNERVHITPIPPIVNNNDHQVDVASSLIKGKYLLFVGTVEPRKGLTTLLDAYEILPMDIRKEFGLVIAGGKGWKDEEIQSKISNLQSHGLNIIKTGYISDSEKATLYKNCSLFIQPSFYEGFGMPIIEAMNYGKPVLCSDIAVFKEVAGTSASYFKVGDPEDLKTNILELITKPEKLTSLGNLAKNRITELPTWEEIGAKTLKKLF